MLTLTTRYEVEHLVPLCDGWQYGPGYDKRLHRPVLITLVSLEMAEQGWFLQWLQKRSELSHAYVAELLDGERIKDAFLCVFAAQNGVTVGLPMLPRVEFYEVLQSIIVGSSVLSEIAQIEFQDWQVLWDGTQPRLLGIPLNPFGSLKGRTRFCAEIGEFILDRLLNSNSDDTVPPYLSVGLQKLTDMASSEDYSCESLSKLIVTFQNTEKLGWQEHGNFVEEEEQALDTADRVTTASPLRGWLLIAVVGVLLVAGFVGWFGRKAMVTIPNQASITGSGYQHRLLMPDLQGSTIPAAVHQLTKLGVQDRQVQVLSQTAGSSPGLILRTDPRAGQNISSTHPVVLYVTVPVGNHLVPQLTGLTLQAAVGKLAAQEIHYSYVEQSAPLEQQGKVVAQTPAPYSVIPAKGRVQMVIATHY